MATATVSDTAQLRVKLELPKQVLADYEAEALEAGGELDEILQNRLIRCVRHDDEKPIYLTDENRQAIERCLRRNLNTPQELVNAIEALVRVEVSGIRTYLYPQLLGRLQTRAIRVDFEKFLPELIVRLLEEYAGLR